MGPYGMFPGGGLGTYTVEGLVAVPPGMYYMIIQRPSYYKQFMEEYKYRPDNPQPQISSNQVLRTIEAEYPDLIDMLVSEGMSPESARQYINRIISITLDHSR